MSERRRTGTVTHRTITALLGAALLAGCAAGPAAAPAPATPAATAAVVYSSPKLVSAAVAAMCAGGSAHVDINTTGPGGGSMSFSIDATESGGRDVDTLDGSAHDAVVFTGQVAYLKADADFLRYGMNLPAAQAGKFAGRWIAVHPGQSLGATSYDVLAGGLTLCALARQFPVGLLMPAGLADVGGQRVIGAQAALPPRSGYGASARAVLWVTDDARLRPVLLELQGSRYVYRMRISRWHERVVLTAPATSVPAGQVTPGKPAS